MLEESLYRFLLGGAAVSVFAVLGDLFRPKSFAGLSGAAPSVALASLGLAFAKHGSTYVAFEGRSMIAGAAALFVYSQLVSWLMMRYRLHALLVSFFSMLLWLAMAWGLWAVFLGQERP